MRKVVKTAAGLVMIAAVIWGYHNGLSHAYQLTCLSNLGCGILLVTDGMANLLAKKTVLVFLYQFLLPCILTDFITVPLSLFGLHEFNFAGAFFFLHIVNPPVFLLVYLFCTKLKVRDRRDYFVRIGTAPAVIIGYAAFDVIRFMITGKLMYGLLPTDMITVASVLIIGIVLYALYAAMSYGLMELKLYVQRRDKTYSSTNPGL